MITVYKKIDQLTDKQLADLQKVNPNALFVSAKADINIDKLKDFVVAKLFEKNV